MILIDTGGEAFDVEQAKLAVDSVRQSLDADRHQYLAALHHDVDTDRHHVHLGIDKVSLDGRVLDRWQDYAKLGPINHLPEPMLTPAAAIARTIPDMLIIGDNSAVSRRWDFQLPFRWS